VLQPYDRIARIRGFAALAATLLVALRRTMLPRASHPEPRMSVDAATVKRIAHLARLKLSEADVAPLQAELNGIIGWIEQLGEIDTAGVEPMTAVIPIKLAWREDLVIDGDARDKVLANAPGAAHGFFAVPGMIE